MFLGMNPGPWGMAQTGKKTEIGKSISKIWKGSLFLLFIGVPFGEVRMVKDFLEVSGVTRSPTKEHPKRKIEGNSHTFMNIATSNQKYVVSAETSVQCAPSFVRVPKK